MKRQFDIATLDNTNPKIETLHDIRYKQVQSTRTMNAYMLQNGETYVIHWLTVMFGVEYSYSRSFLLLIIAMFDIYLFLVQKHFDGHFKGYDSNLKWLTLIYLKSTSMMYSRYVTLNLTFVASFWLLKRFVNGLCW
jgi:hypothetical protein